MYQLTNDKKPFLFSDLDLYSPQVVYDDTAILKSVINLLGTSKYDRFFNPEAYIDIDNIIFSLNLPQMRLYYEKEIAYRIKEKEPRVESVDVKIHPNENDAHSYYIDIALVTVTGTRLKETLKILE